MAKHQIYTVYDRIAEEYAPPWIARNDAVAVRQMLSLMKDSPFPDDFWLFCIGVFNSDSGLIEGDKKPARVPFSINTHIEDNPK